VRGTACISFEESAITEILSTAYWEHVKFHSNYMMYMVANKSNVIIQTFSQKINKLHRKAGILYMKGRGENVY
jgi:hypothetical protein